VAVSSAARDPKSTGTAMSELPHADGQLLIEMIGTWLRYDHPDEIDPSDVVKAADLLRRAGLHRYEIDALFGPCLPPHSFSDDEVEAQHRVGIARFAALRRAFRDDPL
jgi:hypothetical protein